MVHVESEGFRPAFDAPKSVECAEALPICPGYQVNGNLEIGRLPKRTEADHEFGPTLEIWEGWATDPEVRFRASSGGILSALSLYCLEVERFGGVVHAGMDPAKPWMNRNHVSRDRAGVLARTGSRYAPSAPCAGLNDIDENDGLYAFIGKPCDVSAVAELRRRDPPLDARLGLVLTFFCAGTPSTQGTLDLMAGLGAEPRRIDEVHYRGEGWPGRFRMVSGGKAHPKSLSYNESWGRLTGYRPLRCHLCPDGLGRMADIATGDAWDQFDDNGDPGRSLVLVRTERGREFLKRARLAGYVTLNRVRAEKVLRAQKNLLSRRHELFGRLSAFRILGVPIPAYEGFSLFRSWLRIGLTLQARTVIGTLTRILQRGWYRRRILPRSSPREFGTGDRAL
jgi:coenzyme F420 hydrogenase subunit beta